MPDPSNETYDFPQHWWQPATYKDRRPVLLARGRIKSALRCWFESQGYVEVETAALQVSPGNETHLHAFATDLVHPSGCRQRRYLHTSPEFACKKLVAAGEPKLFTFARVFRNREASALHHPEFEMLEWYDITLPYTYAMKQCAELLQVVAAETKRDMWHFGDRTADVSNEPIRMSVATAFERFAGIDLLSTLSPASADRDHFSQLAAAQGYRVAADDTWSDIFSRILVETIEPQIAEMGCVILYHYPLPEAALARPSSLDPRLAERFELYCCGVELANAFGELIDAKIQRARFVVEMNEKQRRYGESYPIDNDFIAALDKMPAATGCAMGFDRLVMLATGAQRVDQVMWTPVQLQSPD